MGWHAASTWKESVQAKKRNQCCRVKHKSLISLHETPQVCSKRGIHSMCLESTLGINGGWLAIWQICIWFFMWTSCCYILFDTFILFVYLLKTTNIKYPVISTKFRIVEMNPSFSHTIIIIEWVLGQIWISICFISCRPKSCKCFYLLNVGIIKKNPDLHLWMEEKRWVMSAVVTNDSNKFQRSRIGKMWLRDRVKELQQEHLQD